MQGQERCTLAAHGQHSEAELSEQPGRGGFGVLLFPTSKESTQPDGREQAASAEGLRSAAPELWATHQQGEASAAFQAFCRSRISE